MKKFKLLYLVLVGSFFITCFELVANSKKPENPYLQTEQLQTVLDTFPVEDRFEDFINSSSSNPFDLNDPKDVKKTVEYDPTSNLYIVTEKIGDDYYRPPTYLTFSEYLDYVAKVQEESYYDYLFDLQNGDEDAKNSRDPMSRIPVEQSLIDRLFGGNEVDINPQGSIDLQLGARYNNSEDPNRQLAQQRNVNMLFDMNIQMDVQAKIGDKLDLNFNYNPQATFDQDNPMKINYNTDNFSEDEIIKKIEAGTVSLPLNGTLIRGSEDLMGLKTELQFGNLRLTALASLDRTEKKSITIEGGAQFQDFQVYADEYDENRHFFLSHYNRDVYEENLTNLPQIQTLFRLQRVEIWITNSSNLTQSSETIKEIVAIADLGEPSRSNMTQSPSENIFIQPPLAPVYTDITGQHGLPDNKANPIYDLITNNPSTRLVEFALSNLSNSPLNFEQTKDFEKVLARKLDNNEYSFHPELGFVSVNVNVRPDQILAVSYQYTYKDRTYQVGQFSEDNPSTTGEPQDQTVLFTKLLKSTTQNVNDPSWDLMMKNVYNIGAYQANRDEFEFDIFYQDPGGGEKRHLPGSSLSGKPLLNVFNLDRLNTQGDPRQDGVFDFVEGVTIQGRTGRIIFPVLEPFGSYLAEELGNTADSSKFVFQQLYDQPKVIAQQAANLNRFFMKGRYKSSISSEISLGAFNVKKESVTVRVGSIVLDESEYEIDGTTGKLRILNEARLLSGAPITIDFENTSLFSVNNKTMVGLRADYKMSDNLSIGATYLHLFERPFTPKVNIGNDPINNKIYGADVTFSKESPFLTRLVDGIPLISTKEKSNINFSAEAAYLKPGHARGINENSGEEKGGVVYIDEFESAISFTQLGRGSANRWAISSVPRGMTKDGLPFLTEGEFINNNLSGVNRAQLSWYQLDFQSISNNPDENPFEVQIVEQEVFKNATNANQFESVNFQTFDVMYDPRARGPYNFDVPGGHGSISRGTDGVNLKDPETRWAGMMRPFNQSDFITANYEFLDFWVMSPFISDDGSGSVAPNANEREGEIYVHLGSVSEDILRDSRKFFEDGLPVDDPNNPNPVDPDDVLVETEWGKVPIRPQIDRNFDNSTIAQQDLGLDGLSNDDERIKYEDFINQFTDPAVRAAIEADPSNDDFLHFGDAAFTAETPAPDKYARFRYPQGNNQRPDDGSNIANFATSATRTPDMEDIDGDFTMNESEAYYSYRIPVEHDGNGGIDMDNEYVIDRVEGLNGRSWYRIKVPIDPTNGQGEVSGTVNENFSVIGQPNLRSIRFMRMIFTGFEDKTIFRFARMNLVRSQWRKYKVESVNPGINPGSEELSTTFDVTNVNYDENSQKLPFGYVIPPGIARERTLGATNLQAFEVEQSLSMNVCDLKAGQQVSIFKNSIFDLRFYEGLKMFVHAEKKPQDITLNDDDLSVFIRIGSDFTHNYYEFEKPLTLSDENSGLTPLDEGYNRVVWNENNDIDIDFELLKQVKLERNNAAGGSLSIPYPLDGFEDLVNDGLIRVKGNPNLGDVKSIQIGIRNNDTNNEAHCAEVWINELRAYGLKEKGGAAALARLDMQLADFGSLSLAGSYSSIGFGALNQSLMERQISEMTDVNVSSSLELGKFFPKDWGVNIPFMAQYSKAVETPKYDPFDRDVTIDERLDNLSPDETASEVLETAKNITTISAVTFTDVKKERNGTDTPLPWDIENFSVSYGKTKVNQSNFIIKENSVTSHTGSLDYGYSNPGVFVKPLKWLPNNKYLKFFSEFNFNPVPNSFTFSTMMDREFAVTEYRFEEIDDEYKTFFNKHWLWNRNYNLSWSIAKSLKLNYFATNMAVIDEPEGFIKNDPNKLQVVKDNLRTLGRNKNFNQSLNVNYSLPFKHIPFLDWVSADISYSSTYTWSAASLNVVDLGNVIQNTQNRSINGKLNMVSLYNKSDVLKKINSKSRRRVNPTGRGGKTSTNKTSTPPGKDKKKKDAEVSKALKAVIRPLMMLRNVNFDYGETFGTIIPGYMPQSEYFGMNEAFTAPGWAFVAGLQPNINSQDYYTENDYLYNNWTWISENQLLNQQVQQNYGQEYSASIDIEPYNDFKIDVDLNRSYTTFHTEDFRRNNITIDVENAIQQDYEHLNARDIGSINMSYITLNTLNRDLVSLFREFEDNRVIVSQRINGDGGLHADTLQAGSGYAAGYGRVQQAVLVPAFLATYTGQDVNLINVDQFDPTKNLVDLIPLPNWTIRYNGLNKIKPFNELFSRFSISHGYKSTITVNQFESDLLFNQDQPELLKESTLDYYTRFEVPDVVISESFSPLIGINVETKTGLSTKLEYKKSRNVQMNFLDGALNETRREDFTFGFGYRLSDFKMPFLKDNSRSKKDDKPSASSNNNRGGRGGGNRGGGLNEVGDLSISLDMSIADDITYRLVLDQEVVEPTRGARRVSLSPKVEYQYSEALSFRLFFDYTRNEPKVGSFPTTSARGGIGIIFSLIGN